MLLTCLCYTRLKFPLTLWLFVWLFITQFEDAPIRRKRYAGMSRNTYLTFQKKLLYFDPALQLLSPCRTSSLHAPRDSPHLHPQTQQRLLHLHTSHSPPLVHLLVASLHYGSLLRLRVTLHMIDHCRKAPTYGAIDIDVEASTSVIVDEETGAVERLLKLPVCQEFCFCRDRRDVALRTVAFCFA